MGCDSIIAMSVDDSLPDDPDTLKQLLRQRTLDLAQARTVAANDVALIATKSGPIVIAVFTYDNKDERWTGDNQAQQMIGKLAEAVVKRWSPGGLDPDSFPWENPLNAGK